MRKNLDLNEIYFFFDISSAISQQIRSFLLSLIPSHFFWPLFDHGSGPLCRNLTSISTLPVECEDLHHREISSRKVALCQSCSLSIQNAIPNPSDRGATILPKTEPRKRPENTHVLVGNFSMSGFFRVAEFTSGRESIRFGFGIMTSNSPPSSPCCSVVVVISRPEGAPPIMDSLINRVISSDPGRYSSVGLNGNNNWKKNISSGKFNRDGFYICTDL